MTSINLWNGHMDVTINIPGCWDELNRQELLIIMGDMLKLEEKGHEAKANIFFNLVALRAAAQKIKLPKFWRQRLNVNDLPAAADSISFLFDDITLTKQLLPQIKVNKKLFGGWLYGPAANFDDLTCGEFEDAKFFFDVYKNNNEPKDLAMLCAVLYRPRSSGKRIPYTDYKAEKTADAFLQIEAEIPMAVLFWFHGCLMTLPGMFPKTFSGNSSGPQDLSAFTKCIHAGAGPKNGTREVIRKMPLKEFFFDMEQEAIKIEELEADNS